MDKAIIILLVVIVGMFSVWNYTQLATTQTHLQQAQTQVEDATAKVKNALQRARQADSNTRVILQEVTAALQALKQQQNEPTQKGQEEVDTILERLKKFGEQLLQNNDVDIEMPDS